MITGIHKDIEVMKTEMREKSVALVGPALYMAGIGLGNEIDSHDIVIRLNRGMESVSKYSEDVGTRTDILYSCLIEKKANAGIIDVDYYKGLNLKMIVAPPHSNFVGYSETTRFHDLVPTPKVEEISEHVPVRIVDADFHADLAREVSCKPNTGFMAIYDILRAEPKSLSIYGFSFYLDGFMPGVKSGVIEERGETEEEFAIKCYISKRHIQENMWKYAKQTLRNNPKVKLDPELEKILNLEIFGKEEYGKN